MRRILIPSYGLFLVLQLLGPSHAAACNARRPDSVHQHSMARPDARLLPRVGGLRECRGGAAAGYPCKDVDLLAFLPLAELGGGAEETGNDVWGWTDSKTGREDALVGLSGGTAFVDLSSPQQPVFLGKLPTQTVATPWRDVKVYRDHAYVVADNAGSHGLQVFDLRQLRSGAAPGGTFTATAVYSRFGSAHNLAINEETGFAYALGSDTCNGGLHMIDLRDPAHPAFAGCYDGDGYTHDAECVVYRGPDSAFRGHEVCFASNEDTLTLVDVSDKAVPVQLARVGYQGSGYTHQGWLTDNHKFFLLDDEADERQFGHRTRTYVWDLSQLRNPRILGQYTAGTNSIDHNLFIYRGYAFQANYQSGLRVLSLDQVSRGRLSEVAFFDVVPDRDGVQFSGSWGVYPFLSSGVVLLTGIEQGLFVLRPQLPGFNPPAAPSNLQAELTTGGVALSWDDNAADEQGVRVLRGVGNGQPSQLAELAADATSYLDGSVQPGVTYGYQVASFNANGEALSPVLKVQVPNARPVTVELQVVTPPPRRPGQPVELRAVFTGSARSARWWLGESGVALSPEPCAADAFCARHVFTTPGEQALRVSVEDTAGRRVEATSSLTVAAGSVDLGAEEALVQSVIFGPRGNTGTFESDLWLHNDAGAPALVDVDLLPRGVGSRGRVHRSVTVEPGSVLFVPNVLPSLFELDNGQGSLAFSYHLPPAEGGGRVRAISRSFVRLNDGSGGSFGQFVAEDRQPLWSAEAKVVTGILEGDGFTSTLLAANLDEQAGGVTVELVDAQGRAVGTPQLLNLGPGLMRFRNTRQLFPVDGRPGPFTARFTSSGIRFVASVTLLETTSEDQVFVPARPADSSPVYYLPRVVRAQGQFNTFLTSYLVARNDAAVPTTLTLALWLRGQDNSAPQTVQRVIPAGGTLVVADVVHELFGLEEATGALQVAWTNTEQRAPRIQSYGLARRQGAAAGQRFGMLVDSLTPASAIATRGVQFGAERSDQFLTSYGVVNLSGRSTTLQLTLRTHSGAQLATTEVRLRPFQHLERNLLGFFEGLGEGQSWILETEVESGGPVLTYLANINASGDVFFVPGGP